MFKRFIRKMLFSLCFIFLFTMRYVDQTFSVALNDLPILAGWESVGVPLAEIQIEGWKKLNTDFMDTQQLGKVAANLEKRLRLRTLAPPVKGDELDFSYITMEGSLEEQVTVVITLQSIRGDAGGAETYCGVIALPTSAEMLAETVRRLERAFAPEVGEMPLAVMLGGVWPGRLSAGEAHQLMRSVFRRLQATESSGVAEDEYGRWSGWSSLIGGKAQRPGRATNLEFAYRYEATVDQTRIALGSPVLPGYF
ncbi:MAG: hypothetical protein GX202_03305 [Firmicutes bacterium]|nr:hypothetical protein [Bacillota bacterium]